MTRDDALDALGLRGSPTPDQINRAYAECAERFHPDHYTSQPGSVHGVMTEKLHQLRQAREVLLQGFESDPRCSICGLALDGGYRCHPCSLLEGRLAALEQRRTSLLAGRDSRLRNAGVIDWLNEVVLGDAMLTGPFGSIRADESKSLKSVEEEEEQVARDLTHRRNQYAATVLADGGPWFQCRKCTAPQVRVSYTTKNRRQLRCNLCSWMERFTLDESEMVRRSL